MLLKGASKEEAFRVGREITERVTAANPKPVKLKFEKARPYLTSVDTKPSYIVFWPPKVVHVQLHQMSSCG